MSIRIRTAKADDLPLIADLMDMSFRDDPTVVYYYRDAWHLFDVEHRKYITLCAAPALATGTVHLTQEGDGVAIWYAPGVAIPDAACAAYCAELAFPDRMEALSTLFNACDAYRPSAPHWSMELSAVAPDAQNRGVGSALMNHGLREAKAAGVPVFIVSSNPMNLPFYQRLGFDLCAKVCLPDMPPLFPMVRCP